MIWWFSAAALLALLLFKRALAPARPIPAARPRPRLPQQILHPGRLPGVRGDSLWRLRPDPHCDNTRGRLGQHVLAREAIDLGELGCDVTRCRCTWRPTPDRRRRREQREAEIEHSGEERRRA
ncbi:hypothetical protein [Pseudomarimonas salicorniae]|uniref:Secreted protein n=1 Tax=Pseudomarimonas salicorniae TaxID=2933270 RepID=A0ABT0GKL8_9GAMM|nr:hypothetical protein [Lysobacter sp. CAU 1642]MCK7595088.1 hypothetical protein [Lysobacter sp. CAU 1642]